MCAVMLFCVYCRTGSYITPASIERTLPPVGFKEQAEVLYISYRRQNIRRGAPCAVGCCLTSLHLTALRRFFSLVCMKPQQPAGLEIQLQSELDVPLACLTQHASEGGTRRIRIRVSKVRVIR